MPTSLMKSYLSYNSNNLVVALNSVFQEFIPLYIQSTFQPLYGAQNEAYMSRSAEKWVRALCFNELGVCG